MNKQERRLFENNTYIRTERLFGILNGSVDPEERDLVEMLEVLKTSEGYVGEEVTEETVWDWVVNMNCEVVW